MATHGEQAYELFSKAIGEQEGAGEWFLIDQERINAFADVTEDHQFIHVDPEQCKTLSPFGVPIAHGFLTLSLMTLLSSTTEQPRIEGAKMGVNYGGEKVRFLTPVRSGKRVRGRFKLLSFTERKPGVWEQRTEFTLEIEGESKSALIAEWIGLVYV